MKRVGFCVLLLGVLALIVLSPGVTASEDPVTVDATIETAESVESALEVAEQTTRQYAAGGATGLGVGLLTGSSLTFLYWRWKIG